MANFSLGVEIKTSPKIMSKELVKKYCNYSTKKAKKKKGEERNSDFQYTGFQLSFIKVIM